MLAYVTRWFSLWASPPVALAFLKDSSVPVSNSRSAWLGVATSGMLVFSLLVWVELRLRLTFGSVARHAVGFAANGLRIAVAQIRRSRLSRHHGPPRLRLNVSPVSARTGSVSARRSIRRRITSQYAGEISQP